MRITSLSLSLLLSNFCLLQSSSNVAAFVTSSSLSSSSTRLFSATTEDAASVWKPSVADLQERRELLRNQKHESEKIGSTKFHHVEFYCGDAKSTAQKFIVALGMELVGETSQQTGNDQCVSYALQSGDELRILLTAPYSQVMASQGANTGKSSELQSTAPNPLPGFVPQEAHDFFQKHGLAARAIALEVSNVQQAFDESVANGAVPVLEPTKMTPCEGQNDGNNDNACTMAEVQLYGDVVLRYLNFDAESSPSSGPFLPHLAPPPPTSRKPKNYGLRRIDHCVGNVHNLLEAHNRIKGFTGFHEFAEFTAEDVGTVDSGLNSVVLASDSENVLLPLNEPTEGRRKSQILTYLEQNEGEGIQHLALKTDDIFKTIEQMRQAEEDFLGFELMKRPSDNYYKELPSRLGDQLTSKQYEKLEELGILADADDEGILLQIFTKPICDRPTFFFEIIQRIGCQLPQEEVEEEKENSILERPGCGGFGQGNFRELFQAIEDHEKTLKV